MRRLMFLCLLLLGAPCAFGQVDLVGEWQHPGGADLAFHEEQDDRAGGPEIGDYLGIPFNEAGRLRAEAYSPSWLVVPEHQCTPHPSTYAFHGPGEITFIKEYDPNTQVLTAYHIYGTYGLERVVWMDGRPHPPAEAPHTFTGFSTGKWDGDKLVVETSHIKASWIRRNGALLSDQVQMVEHFLRHDDTLTILTIVNDPIYYTEPYIKSQDYKLNSRPGLKLADFGNFVAGGTGPNFYKCFPSEEALTDRFHVPHYPPGANPFLDEFAHRFNIPVAATRGGASTMYPEYMQELKRPGGPAMDSGRAVQPVRSQQTDTGVRSIKVGGQVWMISGGGANVTVQVGDEGVLVVDTGREQMADSILVEIRKIAGAKPLRYLINTQMDPDHIGGNLKLGAGPTETAQRAAIVAHENVGFRMSDARLPIAVQPTDTFSREEREMFFNDEPVMVYHPRAAHSDGDVIVFFRKSDVISAGDILVTTSYPVINLEQGGSLNGTIDSLNQIIALTVARYREQGGTYVVPGHGHIYDEADVTEYRDMVTIVRDRIQDAINKRMTLEQIKQAGLTKDYDGRYGSTTGPWTTDMFIEAAYKSLLK